MLDAQGASAMLERTAGFSCERGNIQPKWIYNRAHEQICRSRRRTKRL